MVKNNSRDMNEREYAHSGRLSPRIPEYPIDQKTTKTVSQNFEQALYNKSGYQPYKRITVYLNEKNYI